MTNRLKTLFLAALLPLIGLAAVPASVSRAVRQANEAPALEVTCLINDAPASLTLSGDCFIMDLGEARVYFDGKTQWAYNVPDSEVTVIEPTDEELAETNPLHILRRLEKEYTGAPVKGKPNTVRLTPLSAQSEIAEVTVTFSPSTGWPTSMTIITSGGRADLSGMKFTASQTKSAPSAFKFQVPRGVTVTDLR